MASSQVGTPVMDLALLRAGDGPFFRGLVAEKGPQVQRILQSYASGPDDEEDLYQEVWKRVFEKRAQYDGSGSFDGWLHRVTRSVCLNSVRARRTRSRVEDLARASASDVLSRTAPKDPADVLRAKLRRAKVHEALGRLSARQHEIVFLRVLEDRTAREVSEALGIAEATVRSNLRHAITRLRSSMELPV